MYRTVELNGRTYQVPKDLNGFPICGDDNQLFLLSTRDLQIGSKLCVVSDGKVRQYIMHNLDSVCSVLEEAKYNGVLYAERSICGECGRVVRTTFIASKDEFEKEKATSGMHHYKSARWPIEYLEDEFGYDGCR